jgi:PAS domain S-box-containing protein
MITSKSVAIDELEIQMKERVAELEKDNQELRAKIFELIRSEEAVRRSEEKYRMLFNSIDEGFCVIEKIENEAGKPLDFLYIEANTAFASQSGVEDITGKTLRQLFPEEAEEWFENLDTVLRTGEPIKFKRNLITRGRVLEPFAFRIEDETHHRVAVIFKDITQRKHAEEALSESEERHKVADAAHVKWGRLNSVLDMLPAYVILLSQDYRVPFANRFFEERFGKSWGRRCYEYLFKSTEPCKNCETYRVLKTGAPHHWEWPGPDNRNYDIYDYPFKDSDGSTLIMEVGIDITEIKKAQAAVLEERQRLFGVLETLPAMICLLTPDYKVAFANRSFREKFGESCNRHCYEYCYGCTEPCEFCETYKVLETGQPHHWEINNPDGSVSDAYDFPFTDVDGSQLILEMNIDITERKKAEKALELANAYNRSLIEASLDPLVTIGPDGKITDVNKATESVTGYSRKELIGTDFSNYFTEPEKAKEGYKQVFREGMVLDYSLEIQNRNGHITPVLYNASVYRDEGGEVIGVFAAARDITEHKRAEKELKLANSYNRSLIEASIDPLVTIGPDGKVTDVNNSTESITGYSRKELIGTDFSDYFTEPEKAREGYQHVFQKGLVRDYPLEIRHKEGHVTPVLYNASVYRNEAGEVTGIFAAARDITELKKAEEKIRTLANIVESSNDAIITESLDGIITSWNKGAEQVYGYSAEEVLGKNMSILEPDNIEGETKHLIEKIKKGEKVQNYETFRLKKDSTIINVSVTLSPVFDASGKLVAISSTAGDITEKKISENLLHEKQMAEIANRTKSEFLANMSHELRTPLNSIIGFSDMLYEQAYGELNRKQRRAVGNISNSGKHLLNLINGILDLSKIEANKMDLHYREFELAAKLDLIRNVLYPVAEKKSIDIEINMDRELTRICADEDKFTRIMYNLVDNAIKFSYENSLVKIGAKKKEDLVEITVKDAGIGIKAEDQHKLFKPFSQVNSFSSRKFQGTGLGLSLVKQIVNLHGGYVWFRSEEGEGSTFAFAIPIAPKVKVLSCCH